MGGGFLKPVLKPGGKYPADIHGSEKGYPMNRQAALFTHYAQKINRQHIQLALTLIALVLLVLGVGAPGESGGVGPH